MDTVIPMMMPPRLDAVTPQTIPLTTLADAGAALAARPYARRGVPALDRPIRIVLADDHTLLRVALKALLRSETDVVVVGEAATGREALEQVSRLSPDVLVMDLDMPGGDGLTAMRELTDRGDAVKVLILTMHTEEERLIPLLRAGACGYLSK